MVGRILLSDSTCSIDMKVKIKHFCKFLLQMPVKQHFWPNDGSRMIVKRLSLCVLWWFVVVCDVLWCGLWCFVVFCGV